MDNIYGQDEFERNSIVEIPEDLPERLGNTLYSWLGSLWRSIHEGDAMVRGVQQARGLVLAQMRVDALEALKLQDRRDAPVLHRELWHPVVIRLSERDSAQENLMSIGMDAVIGPQPEGSEYGEGTVLEMGRLAQKERFATYPLPGGIVQMPGVISDNVVNPSTTLRKGEDFWVRNDSIIFLKDKDPLAAGSSFEKYDIPSDDPDKPDAECVLWASDVLVDRNFIADHISYALGVDAPSTDIVKRAVNAAWSSVSSGLTPELVRTLMAAMLNIPVIQGEEETVVSISYDVGDDGATVVTTDAGEYRVSPKAALRRDVFVGATLVRGSLLDESLRIYPYLNGLSMDATDSSGDSSGNGDLAVTLPDAGFSVPLGQDIPSVVLPSDILRVRTSHGLYAMWAASEVKRSPDGNANHLYFDVGGTKEDVVAFWTDIWSKADAQGLAMKDIVGREGSSTSPAAFFLKNLVGANTLFVVVDDTQLDNPSMMRNPMFFGMLSSVVPSATRLFVVEHIGVADHADMDDVSDRASPAAALPRVVDTASCSGDAVVARFVRPPPAKKRARKEEE